MHADCGYSHCLCLFWMPENRGIAVCLKASVARETDLLQHTSLSGELSHQHRTDVISVVLLYHLCYARGKEEGKPVVSLPFLAMLATSHTVTPRTMGPSIFPIDSTAQTLYRFWW